MTAEPTHHACGVALPRHSTYLLLLTVSHQGAFNVGSGAMSYQSLYGLVAKALYRTHVEGKLKAEIIQVLAAS